MNLPNILNVNPRSIYNKINNLKTFIKEKDIDLTCISESWERVENPLANVLDMEDYVVISNPHQRKTQGGRPAIVVNVKKI